MGSAVDGVNRSTILSKPFQVAVAIEEGIGCWRLLRRSCTFSLEIFVDFRLDGIQSEVLPSVLRFDGG